MSFDARNSIAHAISFVTRRKQHIVEKKPELKDVKSPAQLSWRHMYLKAVALWNALSAAEKQEWESLARPKHMTGFAWFMSQCLKPNPGIYLPLQGGTMQGNIDMAKNRLLKLPLPTDAQEALRLAELTAHIAIAAAHHAKTTTAAEITSGRFPVDRLPAMTDERIWKGTGTNVEEVPMPTGLTFTELAGGENHKVSANSTWEAWDISGIIPAGAVSALILITNKDSAYTYTAGARMNGSALVRSFILGRLYGIACLLTQVDVNRVVEIWAQEKSDVMFSVMGYWS